MPAKTIASTQTVDTQVTDPVEDEIEEIEEEEIEDPAKVLELNRKYSRENKALRARTKKAEEELAELRNKSMTEQERAVEEAREQGRKEAEEAMREKLLKSSVRARAADALSDPDDAWLLIDFTDVDPDDEGEIDKLIAALIKSKPYLAKGRSVSAGIDQGPQGASITQGNGNDWLRSVTRR